MFVVGIRPILRRLCSEACLPFLFDRTLVTSSRTALIFPLHYVSSHCLHLFTNNVVMSYEHITPVGLDTMSEPNTMTEPDVTIRPDITMELDSTIEPDGTVEPDSSMKPNNTVELDSSMEPDSAIEPGPMVNPETAGSPHAQHTSPPSF